MRENKVKKKTAYRNEKYYPLLFFIVLPVIGFSATQEFGVFDGNGGTGTVIGLATGVVFYGIWKYFDKNEAK